MKKLLLTVLMLTGLQCFAQDPQFSQYFASPLTLNPALTGFFDGDLRVAANQRQQWWNVGYKYSTTSLSVDTKIFADRLPNDDVFAIGLTGLFEQSLSGALQSNYITGSAAYHKSIDYQGRQMVTLGVQLTYANVYVDAAKLTFASQYNNERFDTSIPVYMGTNYTANNYYDAHAGLLYAAHLRDVNLYAGASVYHLARPVETILNPAGTRIPLRETFHGGGEVIVGPRSSILFSGLFMNQARASDKMIGAAYGLKNDDLNNPFNVYLGMWVRFNDAYIPYLGVDFKNFNVGLNYSRSMNTTFNYKPQTFEISLIYTRRGDDKMPYCPRF